MASLDEIRSARIKKLELLKDKGINPYPARVPRDFSVSEVREKFSDLETQGNPVSIAGRIMAIRGQGAILFVVVFDGTAKIQAIFKRDEVKDFELFTETVDIGDFISVTGTVGKSQTGEESIMTKEWLMAAKSLLPLPEKWHGLTNDDERYRKRYLDLLMNDELRSLFEKKAKFWDVTRKFLKDRGFLEVETPTLELTTGGAEATPFKTHLNDLDLDVYLRISVGELWQKRLMAAGFARTFEIGRVYRNEGTSPDHAQEFTNLEFYAAYMDYVAGMSFTEELIKYVAEQTFGTLDFESKGMKFSLAGTWPQLSYVEAVKEKTGVDVLIAKEDEIENKLKELGVEYDGENRERLTDTLWKYCRKQIVGPVWLVDAPKIVSPLSKSKPDNPNLTERVQLILCGAEVTNGYSELNNPLDQQERFAEQKKLLEAGDSEAMMSDHEFVEMLEHGMPPTFGFAYGDRLFAFLADKPLRELQMFPLMRPKEEKASKKENYEAVAIINEEAKLLPWQVANTIAHLSTAFGARSERDLFKFDVVHTADKQAIKLNIQHAIMIKQSKSSDAIRQLIQRAKENGMEISYFTREMLETTNDNKVKEETSKKKYNDIEFLGVMVFGSQSKIAEITKSLELYS